ncbi:hypothetical protein [Herbiconiux daphne]|uniref:Lipoprotein n=1 Tax=Herbiconiux daphne TaxID=2970914 RepID=A0ABT2H9Y6_9MICO|nr:hypothetical protein [Herbiconiux daphne]MCS5736739.1 hypothetical protein [Herbiconiux daphne]
MKKILLPILMLSACASQPSYAISHAYRAKLERSGCTQVTEANKTCDVNKTKVQNAQSANSSHKSISKFAESLIGDSISHVADTLIADGWKANEGEWHKGKNTLRLIVENNQVVNAQIVN